MSIIVPHLPHLLLDSQLLPVILYWKVTLPLHSPEYSTQIDVGDGHPHQGDEIGEQEEDQLVHVIHEGGRGRAVWPDDQAGCDGHVSAIGDGCGEDQGGAGQGCADGPDGDEDGGGGEGGEGVLGDSYGKVSEMQDMLKKQLS